MLIFLAVFLTLSASSTSGQSLLDRPYINALPSGFLQNFDGWASYEWRPKNSSCVPSCGYGRTIQVTYQCWATTNGGDAIHVVDTWCIDKAGPRPPPAEIPCGIQLLDEDCDCPETVPKLVITHFTECVQPCGGKRERSAKCISYDSFCEQEGSDQLISNCVRSVDLEEDCGRDLLATCSSYSWVGTGRIARNATCGPVEIREEMACQLLIFLRRGLNTFIVPDIECYAFGPLSRESKEAAGVIYRNENCNYNLGEWSTCNATCGRGTQKRTYIRCLQRGRRQVSLEQCSFVPGIVDISTASTKSCSVSCKYVTTKWSACSATCGNGTRQRERRCVQIVDGVKKQVKFHECSKDASVVIQSRREIASCKIKDCASDIPCYYVAGAYGECSATCQGTQTRPITCNATVQGVTRQTKMCVCAELISDPAPESVRPCNDIPCPT